MVEEEFGALYHARKGRPGLPIRLVVGLHYLKHTFNESDQSVVVKFVENPYWQYFCGLEYFQHRGPRPQRIRHLHLVRASILNEANCQYRLVKSQARGAGATAPTGFQSSGPARPACSNPTVDRPAPRPKDAHRFQLRHPARTSTFIHSVAVLRRRGYQVGIVGVGHLLPVALLALALFFRAARLAVMVAAGGLILASGLNARIALIRKAAYLVDLFDRFGILPAPGCAGES